MTDDTSNRSYLIVARPHQGVIAKVAADVGGNDFAIDAVSRDKVFVHAGA